MTDAGKRYILQDFGRDPLSGSGGEKGEKGGRKTGGETGVKIAGPERDEGYLSRSGSAAVFPEPLLSTAELPAAPVVLHVMDRFKRGSVLCFMSVRFI